MGLQPPWPNPQTGNYATVDDQGEVGGTGGTPLNPTAVQAIPVDLSQLPSDVVTSSGVSTANLVPTSNGTGGYAWDPPGTTTLGGDLSGTPADATLEKIQGNAVSASTPTAGEALVWNGADWVPALLAGDAEGEITATTVAALRGNPVSGNAPATNEALIWNGTDWTPTSITNAVTGGALIPIPPATQPAAPTVNDLFEATANTAYALPAPSSGAVLAVLCPAGTTAAAPVTLNVATGDTVYGGVAGAGAASLVLESPGLVVLEGVSATAWWVLVNTARTVVNSFNGRTGPVTPVEGDYAGNLLGKLIYAPTTAETFNVATAGFAALTPAQAVTFNAPSSGAVTVALSADVVIPNGATAGSGLFWALFSGGAQIGPVTAALSLSAAATAAIGVVVTQTIELTGLTAGQQYTLDWAAYSPQTFTMQAGTGAGVADAPPLSMRVLAA
jgi:hypothetical protein